MRKRTVVLLASILILILISGYTMVPVKLRATSSNLRTLSNPIVLKGSGTVDVNFSGVMIFRVERLEGDIQVLVSPLKNAEVRSFAMRVRLLGDGALYWKVEPPCGVPVKAYVQDGAYVFEAEGLGECSDSDVPVFFRAEKFPVELTVEATVRRGLRLYKAEWSFLLEEA